MTQIAASEYKRLMTVGYSLVTPVAGSPCVQRVSTGRAGFNEKPPCIAMRTLCGDRDWVLLGEVSHIGSRQSRIDKLCLLL